jgi:hypothetical protein
MSDLNLLVFGCAVSMIAMSGVYLYIREHFTADQRQAEPVEASSRQARDDAKRRLRKAV